MASPTRPWLLLAGPLYAVSPPRRRYPASSQESLTAPTGHGGNCQDSLRPTSLVHQFCHNPLVKPSDEVSPGSRGRKINSTSWEEEKQSHAVKQHTYSDMGTTVATFKNHLTHKAMVFPVVMYGCESWTIKKAEHWRIDAFELWCWRRLLRVPWIARRSNQSILKEISPGCSLEGLMLKLKLQYFGHLMTHWKRPWCWERLRAGEGVAGGWDGWMASPTQWTWVWVSSGSWWWTRRPGVLRFMGSQRVGHDWATELNWHISYVSAPSLRCAWYDLVQSSGPSSSSSYFQCHTRV